MPADRPGPPPDPTRLEAASALHRAGRMAEAEAAYRAILADEPGHPQVNSNLAVLLRAGGRLDEALACIRRAVWAGRHEAEILGNAVGVLGDAGHPDDARRLARAALGLRPDRAEAWFNLGNVLRQRGDGPSARTAYRRALRLRPDLAEAWSGLGDLHREEAELTEAVAHYRQALALRPDMPEPLVNLGETLKDQGEIHEAIGLLQAGLERHPDLALLHSNLLLALHYTPSIAPAVLARAHRFWARCHADGLRPAAPRHANERSTERRLRVGYVSADFRAHACAHFIAPLLRAHDRTAVETVCYPLGRSADAVTAGLRAWTDEWRPLADLDDAAAAALIQTDGIDLLVDLSGHTAGGRPLLFARQPAPVQVAWLGYPDTTGMTAVAARLTDAVADPPGPADGWHSEALIRLPRGFLCYQALVPVAEPTPPPVATGRPPTFGSFNNLSKVTPEVVALWSRLLAAVPGSRLVLKGRALGDRGTRSRFGRLFAARGIAADRLELLAHADRVEDHLGAYRQIDVGLDPFPYNGTTTTCEALWMGVPVVTLAGSHHVARVGASLLGQVGLDDLVAATMDDYIAVATRLAATPDRLAALRGTLRGRMRASPLCDAAGFARSVEAAYRGLWRAWVGGRLSR